MLFFGGEKSQYAKSDFHFVKENILIILLLIFFSALSPNSSAVDIKAIVPFVENREKMEKKVKNVGHKVRECEAQERAKRAKVQEKKRTL